MKSARILLLAAFVGPHLALAAPAERRCATGPIAPISVILASNTDNSQNVIAMNDIMSEAKITVRSENDGGDVTFHRATLGPGDCVLGNPTETRTVRIATDTRARQLAHESALEAFVRWAKELATVNQTFEPHSLQPVVYLNSADTSKHYGFVEHSDFERIPEDTRHRETSADDLISYNGRHGDLTVVYVLCPADRVEACELSIRHNGDWVLDPETHHRFSMPVLAHSHRKDCPGDVSCRIAPNTDTPQGIYYLWGTLFNEDPAFGKVPRIDLDAASVPVNSAEYAINSYVLSEILPPGSESDYWVNEYPLAFKLGRVFLRVHSTSADEPANYTTPVTHLPFRITSGCINTAHQMPRLLERLKAIGVVDEHAASEDSPLGWHVSPRIGQAFLVVKDRASE